MCIPAIATLEEFQESIANTPVYDDESFALDCLGAGNDRTVTWIKDGGQLPPGDFGPEESGEENDEHISYDQGVGFRSRFLWISPAINAKCDTVTRHNGQYTCTV